MCASLPTEAAAATQLLPEPGGMWGLGEVREGNACGAREEWAGGAAESAEEQV